MSTVKELHQQCKIKKLKGYSKMKKADLIELLNDVKEVEKDNEILGGLDYAENKEEIELPLRDMLLVNPIENKDNGFKLGIHVFKGKDMANSITQAREDCPLNAVQLFTHGPRNTHKVDHDYELVRSAGKGIHMYVHSSYPTNPWNGKAEIFKHTVDQFSSSMDLGSKGVVLHIPKIGPTAVAKPIKTLVAALLKKGLLKGQKVILEMKAVKQHETQSYESPEKINRLIEALKAEGLTANNVGICIDTAHIYAGKADIHTYTAGVKYFEDLKYPQWICLIHLNGNVYDAKKRAGDKHAVPFDHEDKVWKGKTYAESGCRAFIEFAQANGIDFILEVKDHHTVENVNAFVKLVG
jgi:endonuclease IV